MTLPTTVQPVPGESLASILERLARANDLPPSRLIAQLNERGVTTRYLTVAPTPQTLEALVDMTGLPAEELRRATLAAADLQHRLSALENGGPSAHRAVLAQGWVRLRGTQLCPACIENKGVWLTSWHLPMVTTCLTHQLLLATRCPSCRRPFRDQPASRLRPIDSFYECGNPLGAGPRKHCAMDLRSVQRDPAPPKALEVQARIDAALAGRGVTIWGSPSEPSDYLANLQSLSSLILHLAQQPQAAPSRPWTASIQEAARAHPAAKPPRWYISPPEPSILRADVLGESDTILSTDDLRTATDLFTPWYDAAPATNEGLPQWMSDRTRMTSQLTRLSQATHAPRQRLSARIDRGGPSIALDAIPQAVPADLYQEHVAGLMGCGEETGRCFVSLAIARGHDHIHTWEQAAAALGLPAQYGKNTARAVSQRLRGTVGELHEAISSLAPLLDPSMSWRALEDEVRTDATGTTDWLLGWARAYQPRMKETSAPYAITWRWIHEAGGLLSTSPGWASPPSHAQKAAYRQFAASVDHHRGIVRTAIERQTAPVHAIVKQVAHRRTNCGPRRYESEH